MNDVDVRPRTRRAAKQAFLLGTTLVVLYFLVLPQLARGLESADVISAVDPWLLVAALALQLGALASYSMLTRVSLPAEPHLSFVTLLRIQLATKALAHVVPGGSAAGSALGYRLLTGAGVSGAAAGFSLASVGLGSAVVLNAIVWLTLVVSIPVDGVQPGYTAAAAVGAVLLGASAGLVWLLMHGRPRAERVVRALMRPLPFVEADAGSQALHQVADRLNELAQRPDLLRRGTVWAAVNWLLDAASLWVVLLAFGFAVHPVELVVAFGVAQVLTAIPITPGGLGLVETVLPGLLAALTDISLGTAILATLTWRFLQFWLPIPLGALAYGSLRLDRRRALGVVGSFAREVDRVPEHPSRGDPYGSGLSTPDASTHDTSAAEPSTDHSHTDGSSTDDGHLHPTADARPDQPSDAR